MEVDLVMGWVGGGAVGEHSEHVVGRGVTLDGDAVVRFVGGSGEELLEGGASHGGVGADDAEGGGHVWVDHAGTLRDAGD